MLEVGICWECPSQFMRRLEKDLYECPECGWRIDNRVKPKKTKRPQRITLKRLSAYLDYLGDE